MYCVIDTESNGAGFGKERIIEIAMYRYDGHQIVDQFISLINPEAEITPFVQKLTGISMKMVKTAPKFHEVAKRVLELAQDATLVGHNVDFDYRMLRQSFKSLGFEFKINTLDTIPLSKKLIPDAQSYSLGKLVKSLGIAITDRHRASGDARATLDLLKILIDKDVDNEIIRRQFNEANAKTYVNKIKELTQDLPHEKGIVYFQDAKGNILYCDFVDDINKFSKKLFNSESKRWEAVQQGSEKVSYEKVGSHILARLLMKSKNIQKRDTLSYGLYYHKQKYVVEKRRVNPEAEPLLKFRSFTQGLKALHYLKSEERFKDVEVLRKEISLKNRSELWEIAGRTLGEKAFLLIEHGRLKAYGFYEFYSQIQSKEKLKKLSVEVKAAGSEIQNELQLMLLRKEVEIHSLP